MLCVLVQVFQLGVELQPGSSKALCHLGTGQLAEHEATGDQESLHEAELSFRASISMEGKPITAENIPTQLIEQKWWKKKMQAKTSTPEKNQAVSPSSGSAAAASQKATPKGPTSMKQPGKGGTQAGRGRGGTSQPAAANRKPTGPAASKQPAKPVGRGTAGSGTAASKPGQATKTPAAKAGGKTVATLGELKSGTPAGKKPPATPSKAQENVKTSESVKTAGSANTRSTSPPQQPTGKVEVNAKSYLPRLGLARILAKSAADKAKLDESTSLYKAVIAMSPDLHDAYIELGEMLSKSDPVAAVDAYSQFPFSDPPSFNDAYLHGEILRLLMASEKYDDPRLLTSMVAMGRALGIGVLEKQVSILENKFKTDLLKKVYAGVHGKPTDDPDLQAFFKFKCWR